MPNKPVQAAGEAMPRGPSPEYYAAWQKCRDLARQLSEAIAATGDVEHAYIRPAGSDFAVLFGLIPDDAKLQSDDMAHFRLGLLLDEVGSILHYHPTLKIDRISINEHGIHTFHKLPGGPRLSQGDGQ
ncbi:Hypothetical protein NGAL_HAMBI2605_10480 [Neorhizobium galegae bv. orientalis]|nr:Hypothetical protein NGAL_HAMBI2605_10480 [Neorhizobium galegae bv. orientalis]